MRDSSHRIVHQNALNVIIVTDRGRLDPDLADALAGHHVDIPALRDRADDLDTLFHSMPGNRGLRLHLAAFARLRAHDWPGNLTEFRNVVSELLRFDIRDIVTERHVEQVLAGKGGMTQTQSHRDLLLEALYRNAYHRGRTAAQLGISRRTLYSRIRLYGLDRAEAGRKRRFLLCRLV